jgi:hypothetical protein
MDSSAASSSAMPCAGVLSNIKLQEWRHAPFDRLFLALALSGDLFKEPGALARMDRAPCSVMTYTL